MTVYADILFFMNFAFDLEILFILLRLYSKKIRILRLLLSACMGGVLGVFAFTPYFGILLAPPARFFMPALPVAVVFVPCEKKKFAGAWCTFLVISFIYNGLIEFFEIKAVLGLFSLIPICVLLDILRRKVVSKRSTAVLVYKGKRVTADGLFDSGNMLISNGAPVILAGDCVFEKLFGKGFSVEAISEWAEVSDIRVIPYSAVGNHGMLYGIKLDTCIIGKKNYDNAVLGYYGKEIHEELILNGIMT